jgi:hypothetical protein
MKRDRDFKRFGTAIAGLAEVFDTKGNGISSVGMELYFRALEDLEIEDIERAAMEIVRNRVFNGMPKPAEIRETIQGTKEDAAVIAWGKVDAAVRKHGPYPSVQFDDPAIHSAIELMGGWVEFQNVPLDEWKWRRKEFERAYSILVDRGGHSAYLPGWVEQRNLSEGHRQPAPIRIGSGGGYHLKLVKGGE